MVERGDFVKVSIGTGGGHRERIWLEVHSAGELMIYGRVDNEPVSPHLAKDAVIGVSVHSVVEHKLVRPSPSQG